MRIAARFDAAAGTYDAAAQAQRRIGGRLAHSLAALVRAPRRAPRTIVEIGCGTGAFTRELRALAPHARLAAYDLAPAMIATARARVNDPRTTWSVGDGEHATFAPAPEWIAANLAFQWFDDLGGALARHAAQTRLLACSLLLDGTFAEWRTAHERAGLACGLRALPSFAALDAMLARVPDVRIRVRRERVAVAYADGLAFARALRAIGATTPRDAHAPIALRRIVRALPTPFVASYDVAYVLAERSCASS